MTNLESPGISPATRICAVLGHPVVHSASPVMQNAGFAALGLDWRYVAFDVRPEELGAAVAGAKALRFIGLNLTVPHKMLAVDLVDVVDGPARQWGAVNTIRFEGRAPGGDWRPLGVFGAEPPAEVRSVGYNTDADALVRALREDLTLELEGKSVLLLGAGGAGRVAALRLASAGVAALYLINRTTERAVELAREIQQRQVGLEVAVGYPPGEVDLMLNATSLGLKRGDPPPWDETRFAVGRARAVYDMVYRPAETPLLAAARAAGCRVTNGLGMLLYQGAQAVELWSEMPSPLAAMRLALEGTIYGNSSR